MLIMIYFWRTYLNIQRILRCSQKGLIPGIPSSPFYPWEPGYHATCRRGKDLKVNADFSQPGEWTQTSEELPHLVEEESCERDDRRGYYKYQEDHLDTWQALLYRHSPVFCPWTTSMLNLAPFSISTIPSPAPLGSSPANNRPRPSASPDLMMDIY